MWGEEMADGESERGRRTPRPLTCVEGRLINGRNTRAAETRYRGNVRIDIDYVAMIQRDGDRDIQVDLVDLDIRERSCAGW